MRKLWKTIKETWKLYWVDDCRDSDKKHLSQADKRTLWYGGFVMSLLTIGVCFFIIGFNSNRVSRQYDEYTEEILDTIATYMATATQNEYEEIAKTIRHDLVFSEYGQDIEYFIKYIPNTSERCCLEQEGFLSRINIVFPNTGEIYGLDISDSVDTIEDTEFHNNIQMTFGYDEISETSIHITKKTSQSQGTVSISRKRGIISIQKMKSKFCDDCIQGILEAIDNNFITEIVLYDAQLKTMYPVSEGTLFIGDYVLQIIYEKGNYKIDIEYVDY